MSLSLNGAYIKKSYWYELRPVWLLAAAIFVGWIAGLIGDAYSVCPPTIPNSCLTATEYLAQNNGIVVYLHQYYQLVTSILITDSPVDAWFNIIAVVILDRLTYHNFTKAEYFLVFFLTAILGNLVTLLQGPMYASAGASGGIFGIFAAIISYSWIREKRIEKTTLVFFLIVFLGSSVFVSNVNWVAHLGGALGGFMAGPLMYYLKGRSNDTYELKPRAVTYLDLLTASLILFMTIGSAAQFLLFIS